ncbi:MAG TPA: hypothetical protein VNR63_07745 [Gaiellaceae bacterium]|nr:hypothetical protein [Gaiellaceae bacterium]
MTTDDLLLELRRLAERFPLPHPRWHRYVPQMHAVIDDFGDALAAIAGIPEARQELLRLVESDADSPPAGAGGARVAAARERLRQLPLPEGEHPYVDEIRLTLEAAEAALAALAAVAGGDAALAAERERRE